MSELTHARVADRATDRPATPPGTGQGGKRLMLQRRCACGAGAGAGGECDTCAAKALLQRHGHASSASSAPAHDAWPSSVSDTLSRAGRPLDADTRGFMEGRFGHDFSSVRVHDDTAAAASAREVDAQAYTVGQHIVFGDGHYQPHSESGRHLLAHELAHTVQQQGLQRSGVSNLPDHGPEYRRLEAEADQAADRVMRGSPLGAGMLSASGPRLSRAGKGTPKPAPAKSDDHTITATYRDLEVTTGHKVTPEKNLTVKGKGADKELASFKVDFLTLHASKGPVLTEWKSKAKASALRGIITMQGTKAQEAGLWQMRVSSDELRERWVNRLGWKRGDALDEGWKNAYKKATGKTAGDADVFPRVDGVSCEMDHTIELQVGGDNTQENIQILDRADNGMSGSLIKQQVFGLAQSIAEKMVENGEESPAQIRLVFSDARLTGDPNCGPCCKTAKLLGPPTKDGKADKSSQPLMAYEVSAGGRTVTLRVPEKLKSAPIFEAEETSNKAAAELIPGLLLMTLNRSGKKGTDTVNAILDNRDRTRLPISMPAKGTGVLLKVSDAGALTLADAKQDAGIAFTYDYLSPGRFTSLQSVAGGMAGEGYITPTKVPFLKKLDVAFAPDYFRLRAPLDKDKMQPPFPGVKITEATLAMDLAPKLKPVGTIAFEFGTVRKIAAARVDVSADENGLALDGALFVYLPGVDEAKGTISYRGGAWSGGAHIEAGQMKGLPFVKGGAVDVLVKGGKLDAGGKVNLELPGKNEATLELLYTQSKWLFKGSGRIRTKSPYLKPIEAGILYDGELLQAKGKAGFAFSGLDGTVDATYEHKAGKDRVYGKGDIKIDKGRAQGNIVVELHPNETVTGKGKLSYKIKDDMVATAGITIDDKQKITFDGELSFPDIQLFKRFPEKNEVTPIFSVSTRIPFPGASIGPLGVMIKLYGGLGYSYYVGPGVLTGIKATVRFSPFEPDPDFAFSLRAKASIPAGGRITGTLGADVVLDAVIAEAGGGLSVEASAGLEGKAEAEAEIAYSKGGFVVNASAYVGGGIVLSAALKAHVYAEAGVWKFKVRTDKEWTLLGGRIDTGLNLGVRMPLRYDSTKPFQMPALSDIKREPEKLDLNPSAMLDKLIGDASEKDKRS